VKEPLVWDNSVQDVAADNNIILAVDNDQLIPVKASFTVSSELPKMNKYAVQISGSDKFAVQSSLPDKTGAQKYLLDTNAGLNSLLDKNTVQNSFPDKNTLENYFPDKNSVHNTHLDNNTVQNFLLDKDKVQDYGSDNNAAVIHTLPDPTNFISNEDYYNDIHENAIDNYDSKYSTEKEASKTSVGIYKNITLASNFAASTKGPVLSEIPRHSNFATRDPYSSYVDNAAISLSKNKDDQSSTDLSANYFSNEFSMDYGEPAVFNDESFTSTPASNIEGFTVENTLDLWPPNQITASGTIEVAPGKENIVKNPLIIGLQSQSFSGATIEGPKPATLPPFTLSTDQSTSIATSTSSLTNAGLFSTDNLSKGPSLEGQSSNDPSSGGQSSSGPSSGGQYSSGPSSGGQYLSVPSSGGQSLRGPSSGSHSSSRRSTKGQSFGIIVSDGLMSGGVTPSIFNNYSMASYGSSIQSTNSGLLSDDNPTSKPISTSVSSASGGLVPSFLPSDSQTLAVQPADNISSGNQPTGNMHFGDISSGDLSYDNVPFEESSFSDLPLSSSYLSSTDLSHQITGPLFYKDVQNWPVRSTGSWKETAAQDYNELLNAVSHDSPDTSGNGYFVKGGGTFQPSRALSK
jgi:hypothetical protein